MEPETSAVPSPASSTTSPFWTLALVAEIMPVLFTDGIGDRGGGTCAVRITLPPVLATMLPEFDTPVAPSLAWPAGAVMA